MYGQIFVGNDRGTEMHRCLIEESVLTTGRGSCTSQTWQILTIYARTTILNSVQLCAIDN